MQDCEVQQYTGDIAGSYPPCSSPRRARYQQQQAEARQVVRLRGAALLQAEQEARNKLAAEAPATLGRYEAEARRRIAVALCSHTASGALSCPRSVFAPASCSSCACGACRACCACHSSAAKPTSGRRRHARSAIWPGTQHNSSFPGSCTSVPDALHNAQHLQQGQPALGAGSGEGSKQCCVQQAWQARSCSRGVTCNCQCHQWRVSHRPYSAPIECGVGNPTDDSAQHQWQQVSPAHKTVHQQVVQPTGSLSPAGMPHPPKQPQRQKQQRLGCNGSLRACPQEPCRGRSPVHTPRQIAPIEARQSRSGTVVSSRAVQQSCCTRQEIATSGAWSDGGLLQPLLLPSRPVQLSTAMSAVVTEASTAEGSMGMEHGVPCELAVHPAHVPQGSSDCSNCHSLSGKRAASPIAQVMSSCQALAAGVVHRATAVDPLDSMQEPLLLSQQEQQQQQQQHAWLPKGRLQVPKQRRWLLKQEAK